MGMGQNCTTRIWTAGFGPIYHPNAGCEDPLFRGIWASPLGSLVPGPPGVDLSAQRQRRSVALRRARSGEFGRGMLVPLAELRSDGSIKAPGTGPRVRKFMFHLPGRLPFWGCPIFDPQTPQVLTHTQNLGFWRESRLPGSPGPGDEAGGGGRATRFRAFVLRGP